MSLLFWACAETQRRHGQRISLQCTLRQGTDISTASESVQSLSPLIFLVFLNGMSESIVGPISSHCQYKVYHTNLHIQALLQLSVTHTATNQTCLICIPYSMMITYKTFLLTESQTFLKSITFFKNKNISKKLKLILMNTITAKC
jgi:hypothetical protein